MTPMPVDNLPIELWTEILSKVPIQDLMQVRKINTFFHQAVETVAIFKNLKLNITSKNINEIHAAFSDVNNLICKKDYNQLAICDVEDCGKLQYVLSRLSDRVEGVSLENAWIFITLQRTITQLKELTISCSVDANRSFDKPCVESMDFGKFVLLNSIDLSCDNLWPELVGRLLEQLSITYSESDSEPLLKLHKFKIRIFPDLEQYVLKVLENNCCTLTDLKLCFPQTPNSHPKWCEVMSQLHHLESLELTGYGSTAFLGLFFDKLSGKAPLRKFECGLFYFTDELLILIIEKWQKTLTYLDLSFSFHLSDTSVQRLWKLESTLEYLNLSYCSNVTSNGLLEGIARHQNKILTKLYLNYFDKFNEECVIALVHRLPNLFELAMENCRLSVTDKSLSNLFCNQTNLRILVLNECRLISDKGINGMGEAASGISNLRGLQSLSLRHCANISDTSLISSFKFPELRTLILGYCNQLSANGVQNLVANCPAITHLSISCCPIKDEAILHIAIGLKRLRHLNVLHCRRLTIKCIEYLASHCTDQFKSLEINFPNMDLMGQQVRQMLPQVQINS